MPNFDAVIAADHREKISGRLGWGLCFRGHGELIAGCGGHCKCAKEGKPPIIMLLVGVVGAPLCGIPTAIVGIIGIIEGVMYLTKPDQEFVDTYITGRKPWF
ncbi:MAG: hypothetical protein NTV46_16700 [Verrucomicrobia bacterium]|nr:hypothetical protein [Verrucomicrobiota bacterium]